jgi:hypothetical protein
MPFSLYDAVVPSHIQILEALDQVLQKAKSFCIERGSPEAEMIDARLAPDMQPLGYQVKSCAVHSIGAVEGAQAGSFSPDWSAWPTDFDGLRDILQRAGAALRALDRDTVTFQRRELPALVFAAQLLFSRHDSICDLASARHEPRQARLPGRYPRQPLAGPSVRDTTIVLEELRL